MVSMAVAKPHEFHDKRRKSNRAYHGVKEQRNLCDKVACIEVHPAGNDIGLAGGKRKACDFKLCREVVENDKRKESKGDNEKDCRKRAVFGFRFLDCIFFGKVIPDKLGLFIAAFRRARRFFIKGLILDFGQRLLLFGFIVDLQNGLVLRCVRHERHRHYDGVKLNLTAGCDYGLKTACHGTHHRIFDGICNLGRDFLRVLRSGSSRRGFPLRNGRCFGLLNSEFRKIFVLHFRAGVFNGFFRAHGQRFGNYFFVFSFHYITSA